MPRQATTLTIVSGGQTGVDRGALDAALEAGVRCGGWIPEGRMAEDGPIAERYPLRVLPGSGYRQRTRQNVIDSDATLIISVGGIDPKSGTGATLRDCNRVGRPHLIIDAESTVASLAAEMIEDFCRSHRVVRLNVAGPRASNTPLAYDQTRAIIEAFIALRARSIPPAPTRKAAT